MSVGKQVGRRSISAPPSIHQAEHFTKQFNRKGAIGADAANCRFVRLAVVRICHVFLLTKSLAFRQRNELGIVTRRELEASTLPVAGTPCFLGLVNSLFGRGDKVPPDIPRAF